MDEEREDLGGEECKECEGTGKEECGECMGRGGTRFDSDSDGGDPDDFEGEMLTCPQCEGSGERPCSACNGLGRFAEE